jgi:hypothetical protein
MAKRTPSRRRWSTSNGVAPGARGCEPETPSIRVTRRDGTVSEGNEPRCGAGAPSVESLGVDPRVRPAASSLTEDERVIIRLMARVALERWLNRSSE